MEVMALGHAGLSVREREILLQVDPWFAPAGAYAASWFVYPDNLPLVDQLDVPTAVVVTHEHRDHLDPWYLARLPADVPVLIPQYPSPMLRRKLRAAGRTVVIEVPAGERREVARGVGIRFVREASPMNHDAAAVVDTPTGNVVDLNDARLFPMQLRDIRGHLGGRIDVLALQCSGASWFPLVYDYDAVRMTQLRHAKRAAKLSYAARTIEVAEPQHVVPMGGPPCFLDDELIGMNAEMDGGIFPDLRQVTSWLRSQGVDHVELLLPGDSLSVPDGTAVHEPRWAGIWAQDRSTYLRAYAERRRSAIDGELDRYPEPVDDLTEPFAAHGRRLLAMSPYFNRHIDMRVGFDVTGGGGGEWHIDFRAGREGVGAGLADCGYVYQLESRWLPPILAGHVPWEDFFLSLRFRARRDPDLYNDHLLGLLKLADPVALAAVETYEQALDTSGRITVVGADGFRRSVSRWCPHAGSDLLETGEVVDGRLLQCLAHHYRFDLNTGDCSNSRCRPLAVELLLEPDEPAPREVALPETRPRNEPARP